MLPEPVVYVVDDDEAVRGFLSKLFRSVDLEVKTHASGEEFLQADGVRGPGCLILDIRMPGMSGLEIQKELAKRGTELPTIILSGHGNLQIAVQAMKNGAIDFVEKPFNNELLLDRVQAAIAASIKHYRDRAKRQKIADRLDLLTARERQVLDLMVKGATNKVMAGRLNLSEKTIENHRAKMMRKMRAKSLSELFSKLSCLNYEA